MRSIITAETAGPRHWTGRRLECDPASGLFREGLVGGLSYLHPTDSEQPSGYHAFAVRARDLKSRGAWVTKFSWAWSAITVAAGANTGIGALVLDGFVKVLDSRSTTIAALVAEHMQLTEPHARGTMERSDLAACTEDTSELFQHVVEYVRAPSLRVLETLVEQTSPILTRLKSAGLAGYPAYLTVLGVRLLLLQEQAGYGRVDAAHRFVADTQAAAAHHDTMVRRVQVETDPRLMVQGPAVAPIVTAFDQGTVIYYHHKQSVAGGELTGYTALRDGRWVRPDKLSADLRARCDGGPFIDWDARRLDLITTILGPATEIIELMKRAGPVPQMTLLRTHGQEG